MWISIAAIIGLLVGSVLLLFSLLRARNKVANQTATALFVLGLCWLIFFIVCLGAIFLVPISGLGTHGIGVIFSGVCPLFALFLVVVATIAFVLRRIREAIWKKEENEIGELDNPRDNPMVTNLAARKKRGQGSMPLAREEEGIQEEEIELEDL